MTSRRWVEKRILKTDLLACSWCLDYAGAYLEEGTLENLCLLTLPCMMKNGVTYFKNLAV